MTARFHQLQSAVLAVLAKKVANADSTSRKSVLADMSPGERVVPDYEGRPLAAVQVIAGRVNARVTDPRRFAAWVAKHYPDHVEHTPVVREAFQRLVLNSSKKAGEACGPNGELDIPGVDVSVGDPHVSVKLEDDADQIVADMWAAGRIGMDGTVREIEGSDQ